MWSVAFQRKPQSHFCPEFTARIGQKTLCFMSRFCSRVFSIVTCIPVFAAGLVQGAADTAIDPKKPVSFHKHIRPILEANCQGCHQPAKDKGGYVMTDFQRLLAAGDSGKVAVEPKKPESSHLVEQITPRNGEAEMPKGKPPLTQSEIDLLRRWIAEGAKNDTPANAVAAHCSHREQICRRSTLSTCAPIKVLFCPK